jgi:hypothetical protein
MLSVGTILKSETEGVGTLYYRVVSVAKSSYMIKPLCKVKKGFLTIKFDAADDIQILHSEVGFNYLEANNRERARIKEINMEAV